MSWHTIDAICDLMTLENVTERPSLLGLCHIFTWFVPIFARIADPFNKKLRKEEPTTFETLEETERLAFRALQEKLTSPPVLALPRFQGRYIIDTDACDKQIGCILLQQQSDGHDEPISYWSRSLNAMEGAYEAIHRECLAVL